MILKLKFRTDTDAFRNDSAEELSRIFWKISGEVAVGCAKKNIFDRNGELIGEYEIGDDSDVT